jgi:hypothetical protein
VQLFESILGFAEASKVYNFGTTRNSKGKINGWAKFHNLMEHDPCGAVETHKIGTLGKHCVSDKKVYHQDLASSIKPVIDSILSTKML